ncbi:MAG TPA: PAS domain S-box protein [Chthoniobacterales bacterium]|nr:PAS domain S-box protein [Chthoniobacterales bacterium]
MKSKQSAENSKTLASDKLEMLYRGILDTALDGIITMDGDGRVLEFNPAAERTFGFSRSEAIGKELAELIIPSRMREQHRRGLTHYLKTGEGPVIGKRIKIAGVRKDGSEILVELAITALEINSAPIFTAYLRDITDRTRHEEASRHLAAIVESSDDAIVSKDLNGIITSWNRGAEKLFGFSADDVINKPITVIIPPDRYHEEQRILDRIHTGERVDHFDTVRRRKDGNLINVSLTVSPIKHVDGHVIGASKIARDISERVRSDRRRLAQYTVASLLAGSWTLEEASSAILQTIASIGDWVLSALWIYDETIGRLRCCAFWEGGSDKLRKFGQFSQAIQFGMGEGLPGRVWESNEAAWIYDVVVDKNFPRAPAAREAGLHGGFAFPLFAGRAINGVVEMFSEHVAEPDPDLLQLVTALGSQIGLFIERRRIEQELERAKENAEAASAAKDRFLATLSHELRTPLNPILLWADGILNHPGLDPELEQGLRMVCRNVELEARLIDDLLDLTRIARGKLQLRLQPTDAHELIRHAIEIVRADVDCRQLPLSLALEAASHQVNVDPPRVQQVFWNILRNACKFTADTGTISVRSCNSSPNSITVEISDTGIGIEPVFLEKIFDAFEQLEMRREGLGLGLAISKAIVEMHGGSIGAHSEGSGKGATFSVTLPLVP